MTHLHVAMTWADVGRALNVAGRRIDNVTTHHRVAKHGQPANRSDDDHTLGALGELAVSLATGEPWHETIGPDHGGPDVGEFRVRATSHANGGLIVNDEDDDYAPHVLAQLRTLPVFAVVGWLWGYEAKAHPLRHITNGRPPVRIIDPRHLHAMAEWETP